MHRNSLRTVTLVSLVSFTTSLPAQTAPRHIDVAKTYLNERAYGLAAIEARAALALDTGSAEAKQLLEAARRRFVSFGDPGPQDIHFRDSTLRALTHLERGRFLLTQKQPDSAIVEFNAAMVLLPARKVRPFLDARPYLGLAGAYRELQQYQDARNMLNVAQHNAPANPMIYQEGNRLQMVAGKGIRISDRLRTPPPEVTTRGRERAGFGSREGPPPVTMRLGDKTTTTIVAPVINDNAKSGNPATVIRFAEAMAQSVYPEDGILIMRQLVRLHPDQAYIWGRIGWVSFDAQRYADAVSAWAKAVALDVDYFKGRPFEERDNKVALKHAGAQPAMTMEDLEKPL